MGAHRSTWAIRFFLSLMRRRRISRSLCSRNLRFCFSVLGLVGRTQTASASASAAAATASADEPSIIGAEESVCAASAGVPSKSSAKPCDISDIQLAWGGGRIVPWIPECNESRSARCAQLAPSRNSKRLRCCCVKTADEISMSTSPRYCHHGLGFACRHCPVENQYHTKPPSHLN